MIPRRRNHEDSGSAMSSSLSLSSSNNNNTGESNHGRSNSNSNSNNPPVIIPMATSTPTPRHLSARRKRTLSLLAALIALTTWFSQRERVVLDSSNYEDARKVTLNRKDYEPYSTLHRYKRNPNAPSGKFVLAPTNEFSPGIAWLMSFPNSGTSFTMTMVSRSTNKSFATNYGNEVIAPDETDSHSIYPRRPEGPYWPGLSGKQHTPRDLPDTYVITKTHCGSRCSKCGPDEYIETTEQFLTRCASGHGEFTPGSKRRTYDSVYPADWVQRAIHLYRNPMHNIIARYHLEHRHKGYKNDTKWQESHQNDAEGLHKWCEGTRETYRDEDIAFFGSEAAVPDDAPCHGEFYKWTQWHNLAEESLRVLREGGLEGGPRREVPVLKVYYEDYKTRFETTAKSVLDFLELEQVAPFREFSSRSDYGDYFPLPELIAIKKLIRSVATNTTWTDVQHYFDGVPDDDEE